MILLFAFILIPSALVCATFLFSYLLDRPQFAGAREALTRWKYRWVAYAIPFSPAMTMVILRMFPGTVATIIPAMARVGILLSSIGSAAVATSWLCLPDDSTRRPQMGYAALLSIVLWLLDIIAIGVLRLILR